MRQKFINNKNENENENENKHKQFFYSVHHVIFYNSYDKHWNWYLFCLLLVCESK